ncbi:MAG: hypothetical protein IT353_03495 [Gemmatimonadaceae bacterium]|nr:hypothetical protein [Gemmatimonadaceae bacterium]
MNVTKAFTPFPDTRPEPAVRHEPAARPDRRAPGAPRANDRTTRTEASARRSRVADRPETEAPDSTARAAAREKFSELLALLSGADESVRSALASQVPDEGRALIDQLLNGSFDAAAFDDALNELAGSSNAATVSDSLRYGLLQGPSSARRLVQSIELSTLASPTSGDIGPNGVKDSRIDGQARLNDLLSRITARRGATPEQLKARGDDDAAGFRITLDEILGTAGTSVGLALAAAADREAMVAAATAMANARAASAADVSTPVRDTDALAPELRARLDRVIGRMKQEYGHDVTIVETTRSQERQNFLYEQGRSRSGPVVTWTRDSAHLTGDAVDVLVDGSWNNADGFGRLQRIAQEEGLRTLGVRDPGHLELPRELRSAGQSASVMAAMQTRAATTNATAIPVVATPLIASAPSGVARVANVARTAGVARVAQSGQGRAFDGAYAPAATNATAVNAPATAGESGEQSSTLSESSVDAHAPRSTRTDRDSHEHTPAFGALHTSAAQAVPSTEQTSPAAPTTGISQAERVADVQSLRENVPAGTVSRMTLNVDAPDGGQDRVTVEVRGSQVGTAINTDAANADRLRVRTADLQDALGRHGLESESVRISGTTRSESGDAARAVAGERDGLRLNAAQQSATGDGATSQGQRERGAAAREWDRPESSRQSREEAQDDARQGAGQRGRRAPYNGSEQ